MRRAFGLLSGKWKLEILYQTAAVVLLPLYGDAEVCWWIGVKNGAQAMGSVVEQIQL